MKITLREWLLLVAICACVCWCVLLQQRLARSWEIKSISGYNGDVTGRVSLQVFFVGGGVLHFHRGMLHQTNPEMLKAIELVEADQRK